jgi:hypothetical protein
MYEYIHADPFCLSPNLCYISCPMSSPKSSKPRCNQIAQRRPLLLPEATLYHYSVFLPGFIYTNIRLSQLENGKRLFCPSKDLADGQSVGPHTSQCHCDTDQIDHDQ